MNHFYGQYTEEHYEVDIKDLSFSEKCLLLSFLALIILDIVVGFLGLFEILVITVGFSVCTMTLVICTIFYIKLFKHYVITPFFFIGLITTIVGFLLYFDVFEDSEGATNALKLLELYSPMFFVILGFVFIAIGAKKNQFKKRCTTRVTATCYTVDTRRVNLFKCDDISSIYSSPINQNDLLKPAFLFWLNGYQYFVENKYFYGDLNTEFADGKQIGLFVNPQNPTDIVPDSNVEKVFPMTGWSFVIVGVLCQILFLVMHTYVDGFLN